MKTECSSEYHAAAWLAGEMPPGESAAFEQHLSECTACRQAVETTRRVVHRLRSISPPALQRDLAPAIIAQLHARPKIISFDASRWMRLAVASIAVLLLPAAVVFWLKQSGHNDPAIASTGLNAVAAATAEDVEDDTAQVSRALDWFYVHQEIDGSWDPEKWGGNRRFKTALTALPLISLLKGARSPEHLETAERALAWLRREQQEDGSFSRAFGDAGYNHAIATLALLHAWEARPEPELKDSITAALNFAFRTRTAVGGWGESMNPDVSVTLWYREMLELASRLGWHEAAPALVKVRTWLESKTPSGAIEPELKECDYLEAYFAVTALLREGTEEASARLSAIRRQLATTQSRAGHYPGTWEPSGSWGRAGGRIYSTAMACLALR